MQNGFKALKPIEMWVPKNATVNIACIDWMVDSIVKISEKMKVLAKSFIYQILIPQSSWLMEKKPKNS